MWSSDRDKTVIDGNNRLDLDVLEYEDRKKDILGFDSGSNLFNL